MPSYDARVFQVGRGRPGEKPVPTELGPRSVKGNSKDKAKAALDKLLTAEGFKVRSINWGPDRAGRLSLIAYVWEGS